MPVTGLPNNNAIANLKRVLKEVADDGAFSASTGEPGMVRAATEQALKSLKSRPQIETLVERVNKSVDELEWYGNYGMKDNFENALNIMKNERLKALKAEAVIDASFP